MGSKSKSERFSIFGSSRIFFQCAPLKTFNGSVRNGSVGSAILSVGNPYYRIPYFFPKFDGNHYYFVLSLFFYFFVRGSVSYGGFLVWCDHCTNTRRTFTKHFVGHNSARLSPFDLRFCMQLETAKIKTFPGPGPHRA